MPSIGVNWPSREVRQPCGVFPQQFRREFSVKKELLKRDFEFECSCSSRYLRYRNNKKYHIQKKRRRKRIEAWFRILIFMFVLTETMGERGPHLATCEICCLICECTCVNDPYFQKSNARRVNKSVSSLTVDAAFDCSNRHLHNFDIWFP